MLARFEKHVCILLCEHPHNAMRVLVLLLALCSTVNAVEIVTANERAPRNTMLANGIDVYGRDVRCRACHAILNALNAQLVPKISKALTGAREYGAFDAMIEDALQSTCRLSGTWHDASTRKACEQLMELHEDAVGAAYHKWIKRGGGVESQPRKTFGRMAGEPNYDPVGWNWNWEVCGKAMEGACKQQLAMHHLSEFDDDDADASETEQRKYRSEPKPAEGELIDGMLKVTAGTFHEVAVRQNDVDVLVYTGYPRKDKWLHFYLASALGGVREMFQGNATAKGAFEIAYVDATHNDVPPPYGNDIEKPTVALFAKGSKNWPRYMTDLNEGKLTPYEILNFIISTSGNVQTVSHANWLILNTPDSVLYRKVFDDNEEL